MIKECPGKYLVLAERLSRLFGLTEWRIIVGERDEPGGRDDIDGTCQANARYTMATIHMHRALKEEDQQETLIHEFLHIALAEIDQAVEKRIVELLPETEQEHARALYNDALERTIVRLARGLREVVGLW